MLSCLTFILLYSTLVVGQKVFPEKVIFIGIHHLSLEEVNQVLSIHYSDSFDLSKINQKNEEFRKYCFNKGLIGSKIDSLVTSIEKNVQTVKVYLSEGESLLLRKISFNGNPDKDTVNFLNFFNSIISYPYVSENLNTCIKNLIYDLSLKGYPYAKISIKDYNIERSTNASYIDLDLFIDNGGLVKINNIVISGNETTKDYVILRYSNLKQGQTYNQKLVNEIVENLNRLNIFKGISDPVLTLGENGGILNINITEGNYNNFNGVLGYQPSSKSNGYGYFTGIVDVTFKNLFGTGRKFKVFWSRENESSQQFILSYLEPWFLNLPVNIYANFEQRQQDSVFVKRNILLSSDVNLFENSNFKILGSVEKVIPGSENLVNSYIFNNSAYFIGGEFSIDTRDDIIFPKYGLFYLNKFEIGKKKYSSDQVGFQNKIVKKFQMNFQWINKTFSNQFFFFSLNGLVVSTSNYEFSDLLPFGGFNTIRGYKENQFYGTQNIWSNFEYRFNIDQSSFIYPFFDYGYYHLPKTIDGFDEQKSFLWGYGIGVNIETSVGMIKVNYALGRGDSFSGGKIHFGFLNNF